MAENKSQTDDPQNLDPVDDPSTQNTDVVDPDKSGSVSSAGQEDAFTKRLNAIEAQLERERERNRLLEQSLQIQEKYLNQGKTTDNVDPVNKELDVLDKALDPILNKRFKSQVDPINQRYNALSEDNDALRFEMFLQRNNPEILEDEDSYNSTIQQIDAVRQAARQRGMEVSRVDAFFFNEGIKGTKSKISERKAKRGNTVTAETRRQSETRAASGTSTTSEPRQSANAGIAAIREKASRGERLTNEERVKFKEYVSNVEI